jgi:DNA (cytosine-5)-methyltransferase 1
MSDGPVFLDFFAGFGGSSSGLVEAGYQLATAYNHWDKAIAVHSANHREADHFQGDLSGLDMRRLPRNAEVLWASPECTWHSPAGGRKRPRAAGTDLFGEPEPSPEAGIRSRATMFDPIRAAEARGFKAVMIENVPEVADWPLFPAWLKMWEALGYSWQIVNVSAAHVYGPGNAPAGQWRDRIYIVLAAPGVRIPRIEPRPLAWCSQCDAVVESRQDWKKPVAPGAPQVGKYGRQYVYVCGANAHARTVVEPYVLPAAAVIDWSDLGVRIGDRAALGMRPLAAATMRRIEVGARMFARPAVVAHHGQTYDAAREDHRAFGQPDAYYRAWAADAAPLMTRQAGGTGDALSVPPYITAVNHDADDRALDLASGPLATRSTKIGDGLVFPPFVTHHYGDGGGRNGDRRVTAAELPLGAMTTTMSQGVAMPPYVVEYFGTSTARDTDQPMSAVLAGAAHHGLAVPPGAFLSKHHGGLDYPRIEHMNKSPFEPMPTLVAAPNVSLVIPQRKRPEHSYEGELPFELDDVRFRMIGPTEHLRAQRFWEGYDTSAANKTETTKGAGNAVPVNVAHWIGAEVKQALA